MNKITKQYLQDYVQDVGDIETEHRKYSSFYANCSCTLKQDDIDTLSKEGVDASEFLNVCVTLNGMWSDSDGCDWTSVDFCKVEEYQELVPEQVIPAHYVTKQKTEVLVPVWE